MMSDISQNSHIKCGPQVIDIRDEQIFVAALKEGVEQTRGSERDINLTMTRWAPLEIRVVRPRSRSKCILQDFRNLVLQDAERNAAPQFRVATKQLTRFRICVETVH